jgi:hypothetical protein
LYRLSFPSFLYFIDFTSSYAGSITSVQLLKTKTFPPFSIASSIVDDGSHFKLWRDQVLVKFFSSYGMIIALNILIMLASFVMNPDLYFFDDSFLNFCIKVLVILGSALGLNKSMGLVGNLISSGAGSNELRDAAATRGSVLGALGMPLSPLTSIGSEALNQKKRDLAGRTLKSLGLGIKDNGQTNDNGDKDSKSDEKDNQNTNTPNYNNNKKGVTMAISNDFGMNDSKDDQDDNNDDDNKNDNKPKDSVGQNMVTDAIKDSFGGDK